MGINEQMKQKEQEYWTLRLNELEAAYYKARWDARNRFERYFRQSPYSSYETEEDLIAELNKLSDMKEGLCSIKTKLIGEKK